MPPALVQLSARGIGRARALLRPSVHGERCVSLESKADSAVGAVPKLTAA